MNEENVVFIHHKYYTEVINNKWGTQNLESGDINVNGFYFKTHPNDTVISDSLRQGILFEKFYLSFLKQFINPNKNVLDIGANIGVHSVIYSNYLTSGKVYSFEPQKVVYDILLANLNKNKCHNVIPLNIGVSNSNTQLFMAVDYDSKENQGGFAICEKSEGVNGITIECRRIDDHNISNVGYVKIDVEGHEYEALLGMKELMKRDKPFLFIEIHEFSPTKNAVFQLIEDFGYTQYMKMSHCDYLFMGV
jgi:FkbM family methyltransferase